ncbi:MAG: hypothetical protein HONBIEJF_02867 [Fimbriimonadaceae bacterium]|nr:hypothetical protein [Fimbriimonadaceae bacterium]
MTETYVTNARDELLSVLVDGVPVREYTVDLAGRTTAVTTGAGTTTFAYDFEDRVTSVSYPGSGSSTYGYNGLDTRVSASGSFGSRTYRRAGAGVTAPVLGDGVSHFTPGVSVRTGSDTRYQHAGLKNIDAQSSGSQSISATQTYDAFGQTLGSSGSWSGPFGYGGAFGYQSEPDSGLQLLGHRYYDPSAGRFLSRDKARDGGNWYAYCGNSPLTSADPTGKTPVHVVIGLVVAEITIYNFLDSANDAYNFVTDPSPMTGAILAIGYIDPGPVGKALFKKLVKAIPDGASQLQKNILKGKAAEAAAKADLEARGHTDVQFKRNYEKTPEGRRMYDLDSITPEGTPAKTEVKAGDSPYEGTKQESKDQFLEERDGIPVHEMRFR